MITTASYRASLPARHQAALARIGRIDLDQLRRATAKAEEICADSRTALNPGLLISVLERQAITRDDVSRVGKLWARGLDALLIPDDQLGL